MNKKITIIKFLLSISFVVGFLSCKKEPIEPIIDYGYDYYPIEVGFWQIYNVETTTWNDFDNSVKTEIYQWKELIESQIITDKNDTLYRLECYQRNHPNDGWALKKIYLLRKETQCIERYEENMIFCKMIFPIQPNSSWNEYLRIDSTIFYANHYFNTNIINPTVKSTNAIVKEFKTEKTINNQYFENCIGIDLHSFSTIISEDSEKEYYAHGVGLVSQSIIHVEKNISGGSSTIKKGYVLEKTIVDYKK